MAATSPSTSHITSHITALTTFTGAAAAHYQRYFVPAIGAPAAEPLLAAAALRPGDRVLDVACGTGVVARLAAPLVGDGGAVAAIDLAPDMIDVARAEPRPAGPPIAWHVADAAALPFGDATHDAVLCPLGLMFMADRAAAVAEMHRVLARGGRVVVSMPGPIQPVFAVLERALVDHLGADAGIFVRAVFSMPDPDDAATLLRGPGFADVTADVVTVRLRLPAPADFLWQYVHLSPLAPLVTAAPVATRRAIERQAVEAWQPHVVDGGLAVDQPLVIARGLR